MNEEQLLSTTNKVKNYQLIPYFSPSANHPRVSRDMKSIYLTA